ncbi:DNA polymerase processivity subunit [Falconid herpesvirus 1]|uniref:DNA polymerase processivity factor n=2 Tax=Columbid alphaherpesvirus 1 TaxID=93386 RepID=A0A068EP93_9ALPH|nr:DNA polymerase processivity subunit [Falconid herpesvirus 1]YP_009352950.1 DNA polymerase processivity subunit [Columbid alphaherpesvirus 1]AID52746.1 DNA polymerase processivity subunit [Falconid herpesvirus 1]ARD71367.1 DNA polymerase processivity subunit [Columbid alphaherpesvirus 1]
MATFRRDSVQREDEGEPQPAWRITLAGCDLDAATTALRPLTNCIKNPLLTFGAEGMVVQGSVCGQRVFIPIMAKDFSEYNWRGPTAIFLALTDSRRTLLDPFKSDKKKSAVEITFNFHGESPCRNLTQTVTYATAGNECCTFSTTVVKYELWTSSVLCPNAEPDVTFSINKQQLGRIFGLASKLQHEELVFSLKPEGGFFVGTVCEVLAFDVDGAGLTDYHCSAALEGTAMAAVMKAAAKKTSRGSSAATTVVASGSGKPFCLGLEDTNAFKNLLQKIRQGTKGLDLCFYTSTETPMLKISLHAASGCTTAFLFCTTECIPIHELEEVSSTVGAVKVKPTAAPAPKGKSRKRPTPADAPCDSTAGKKLKGLSS